MLEITCGNCARYDSNNCRFVALSHPSPVTGACSRWLANELLAAGRRAGLEEAIAIARDHRGDSVLVLRMKLQEALEAEWSALYHYHQAKRVAELLARRDWRREHK